MSIYSERTRQLESVLNQTPLLQAVANRKFSYVPSCCEGLPWHAETNPIEFCAVVLEIENKGRWLGEAMFVIAIVVG